MLLIQAMYLAFYLGALGNIPEIREIFADSGILSPAILTTVLVITAVALIPVRLFLFTAVVFDFQQLAAKFKRLFPVLLWMDLLWALSPFLLIHHISGGLALGMTAALVYMPFAQRSLVLMYCRDHEIELCECGSRKMQQAPRIEPSPFSKCWLLQQPRARQK